MSAFQAYAGAYEHRGRRVRWRCYATVRIYDLRRSEHAPLPPAPAGKKWTGHPPHSRDTEVHWMVDESVADFSQILLQVESDAPAPERRAKVLAAGAAA